MANPVIESEWNALPRVKVDREPSQDAGVADPNAWRTDGSVEKLAEHVATRVEYAQVDKECLQAARAMLRQANGDLDGLLDAYDRMEKPRGGECETFFVRVARLNPPFWQVRQIVAEWKRGMAPKKRWYDGFEEFVKR